MKEHLLLTDGEGYLGKAILESLSTTKYDISVISSKQIQNLHRKEGVNYINIELSDNKKLIDFLNGEKFDGIVHTGTLIYKKFIKATEYAPVNTESTLNLIYKAMSQDIPLVFFSTLGIFGRLPAELPVCERTLENPHNEYHRSMQISEHLIKNYCMKGLKAIILRPSMLYGNGDFGLSYRMVDYVDKKSLVLPNRRVKIHLTNIELIIQSLRRILEGDIEFGEAFIVADVEPVILTDLVRFISRQIHETDYPDSLIIDDFIYYSRYKYALRKTETLYHGKHYQFYHSWYFDTINAHNKLSLRSIKTIPEFKHTIDFYINNKSAKRK
ncbi:MAG: NAD(P)-dependent oxidoreductase [Candidatus Cloacimonetes bacterium]|nr:NAD(P)-dependent oxidoreductase [Candidatus Cloacimonadota bacterium]